MIPQELLSKIYEIEIVTKRRICEVNPGNHPSIFLGQGFDFDEHREYFPGDDVRNIDWNLVARFPGKVYVRRFREEKQLTVWILADLSGSTGFGHSDLTKKELLVKSAAYLGFSAAHELDKVGLILFTDKIKKQLRPKSGKSWVIHILNKMWDFSLSEKTDITYVLKKAQGYFKGATMIFLLSDFLDKNCLERDSTFWQEIKKIVGSHDLIPVVLGEDESFLLDVRGNIDLRDLENGRRLSFHLSKKNQKKFVEGMEKHYSILRDLFMESGTRAIFIKTEADLNKFFKFFLIRKRGER